MKRIFIILVTICMTIVAVCFAAACGDKADNKTGCIAGSADWNAAITKYADDVDAGAFVCYSPNNDYPGATGDVNSEYMIQKTAWNLFTKEIAAILNATQDKYDEWIQPYTGNWINVSDGYSCYKIKTDKYSEFIDAVKAQNGYLAGSYYYLNEYENANASMYFIFKDTTKKITYIHFSTGVQGEYNEWSILYN